VKGRVIQKMKEFVGSIEDGITDIRLWHVHFVPLNFDGLIHF
jgi:hypothetical protein